MSKWKIMCFSPSLNQCVSNKTCYLIWRWWSLSTVKGHIYGATFAVNKGLHKLHLLFLGKSTMAQKLGGPGFNFCSVSSYLTLAKHLALWESFSSSWKWRGRSFDLDQLIDSF